MMVVSFLLIASMGVITHIASLAYAPIDFPTGRIIHIEEGKNLKEIAQDFEGRFVVRSALMFESYVRWYGKEEGVMAGDYFFEDVYSVMDVARRVTTGEFGLVPIKITVMEGATIFDIASQFEKKFTEFDAVSFIALARDMEGYLFPDTYLFLPNVTEEQVIDELNRIFYEKTAHLQEPLVEKDMTFEEIVILASIIQGEAWKKNDQRLISGVLHNRLSIDMPLQVDATFAYINGKNTYELTYSDLAIDSLYNTYKYKGLPIGPISNPGLAALEAAVFPEDNNYIFYLADRSGNTYYSRTYEEHLRNKAMYVN